MQQRVLLGHHVDRFVLVARLWKAHRDWSRYYDIEDGTTIVLSLALVFMVVIFVHPLRLLFALLFVWISAGYLVDQPVGLHDIEELRHDRRDSATLAESVIAAVRDGRRMTPDRLALEEWILLMRAAPVILAQGASLS